jgi:hypothetical protein
VRLLAQFDSRLALDEFDGVFNRLIPQAVGQSGTAELTQTRSPCTARGPVAPPSSARHNRQPASST